MSSSRTYTITEAKAQLSDIIRRVKKGESITIGAGRTPEVELVLYKPKKKDRTFGKLRGKIWMSDSFNERDLEIEKLFNGDTDDESVPS